MEIEGIRCGEELMMGCSEGRELYGIIHGQWELMNLDILFLSNTMRKPKNKAPYGR